MFLFVAIALKPYFTLTVGGCSGILAVFSANLAVSLLLIYPSVGTQATVVVEVSSRTGHLVMVKTFSIYESDRYISKESLPLTTDQHLQLKPNNGSYHY